jgi:lipopolysaccharide transport system permease protein
MVRYRQTLIGAGWAVLQPLLLMVLFTVFFTLMDRFPSQGLPYPVFFLLGLLPYQLASKVLLEGSASVVANASLLNRVYFPRVYFPVAASVSSLVNLLFGLVPLAALLLYFGVVPGWPVVLIPLFVAIALVAALGVALWLSALNVTYRDITQLLPFIAQAWMFTSPVIYPSTIIPEAWRWAYYLNPLVCVIDAFRWAFAGAPAPPVAGCVSGAVVAIGLLGTGYVFFRKRESTFSDVV